MSSISLIASGTHGSGFGGDRPCGSVAVDVSAYSTLRLTLDVTSANAAAFTTSNRGHLQVWIETSADGSAGWRPVLDFEDVVAAVASQRAVLAGFDAFIRVGWKARSMDANVDPAFVWSLTGDAKPDDPS
jgi:hypothetical protein